MMSVELGQGVIKFLKRLSDFVEKTKTIILTYGSFSIPTKHAPNVIEMKALSRDHAAECLRRVLLLENKLTYQKKDLI